MDIDYIDYLNDTDYINYTSAEWNISDRNLSRDMAHDALGNFFQDFPAWLNFLNLSICSIELFLLLPAIKGIWFLSKTDHGAPVYIINLLISDVFQIFGRFSLEMLPSVSPGSHLGILVTGLLCLLLWSCSFIASIGFMVCIAAERYIVIVHPIWYRTRRTKKFSVCVSILVWISPFFELLLFLVIDLSGRAENGIFALVLLWLLPLPLLIFFVVQTGKALYSSQSVRLGEKRRIMAIQILVLCIYTLLYLPFAIGCFIVFFVSSEYIYRYILYIQLTCLHLSPFFDVILYVYVRKNVGNMWHFLCCKNCCGSKLQDQSPSSDSAPTLVLQ